MISISRRKGLTSCYNCRPGARACWASRAAFASFKAAHSDWEPPRPCRHPTSSRPFESKLRTRFTDDDAKSGLVQDGVWDAAGTARRVFGTAVPDPFLLNPVISCVADSTGICKTSVLRSRSAGEIRRRLQCQWGMSRPRGRHMPENASACRTGAHERNIPTRSASVDSPKAEMLARHRCASQRNARANVIYATPSAKKSLAHLGIIGGLADIAI
jgi:hypothetical protein